MTTYVSRVNLGVFHAAATTWSGINSSLRLLMLLVYLDRCCCEITSFLDIMITLPYSSLCFSIHYHPIVIILLSSSCSSPVHERTVHNPF